MKIIDISFFDMDGCLLLTPEDTKENREKWENFYGEKYPHAGWWSKKESLDIKVYDIKVFNKLEKYLDVDYLHHKYILTARMSKLLPQIKDIVDNLNINDKIKDIITKSGNTEKWEYILNTIKSYNDNGVIVRNVFFYDDMIKHIQLMKENYTTIKNSIVGDFKTYIVDQEKNTINLI